MPKCIYFEGIQEYISEEKKNRWQKSENFWFCGSIKCSWRTLLCSQTHAKYTHKQIAYNQCLKLPVDGKAESKWWSLCRGSLKACGLEVSLYTFLFSERVAVCVCVWACITIYPAITVSIVRGCQATMNKTGAEIAGWEEGIQPFMALGQHYIFISGLNTAFKFYGLVEKRATERRYFIKVSERI